ncbi:MAG: hypothetical protein K0M60_12330, partial [Hydrogenophaga sp.]|nr:hypothetical protein [Hydrogenophaga sp.]
DGRSHALRNDPASGRIRHVLLGLTALAGSPPSGPVTKNSKTGAVCSTAPVFSCRKKDKFLL